MEKGLYLRNKPKQSPKPAPPPLPAAVKLPVKTDSDSDSAYDINEIGRNDSSFELELNRKNILQGIILAEVFGKPKGIRRYRK